jgi:hypothetical protein
MAETDFNTFVKDIAQGSDAARLALAEQLKKAGLWTGKVSSAFNTRYYNALVKLESEFKSQQSIDKIAGITTPKGRYDVLTTIISEGGSGGSSGPKTTAQTYVTSPTQTAKLVNTIAQDLLGRNLTKAEQAKYLKFVNAAQKAEPTMQTTGSGYTSTRGGVDEEQLVTEQIAQTGEARTKRATDAYALMMNELGGLQ